jgi:low affinity Fe/Cu permease
VALTVVIVWAVTGPIFHYSDTWQLVINTGTIITFLMVFLIQNTQTRDTIALQLKLDDLLWRPRARATALSESKTPLKSK